MQYRLILLTMLLLPVALVQAQVAEEDSLALVGLYNATDGPNWADNANWLTTPVSEWHGVTVTGERVISLDLISNQLTGSIPAELGNLTNLTNLSLVANRLTGSIPVELGNLVNLRHLSLGANGLTGSIPPELGSLASLATLFLSDSGLTGSIPPELGNLTNLTSLLLGFNGLTGSIPPELGNLTNLTRLSLESSELTGSIPPELGNLVNLTSLELQNTPLSGTLPLSLTNLSSLNTFWFNNTNLCEPTDIAFQTWIQGISSVLSTGCTNVSTERVAEPPTDFVLDQNYPNPFNPQTTIQYGLPQTALVRLQVFDAIGRRVRMLVDKRQPPGWHEVIFDAGNLPSGLYFYRLEAGSFEASGQMLLAK